jgi:hypothetical protein
MVSAIYWRHLLKLERSTVCTAHANNVAGLQGIVNATTTGPNGNDQRSPVFFKDSFILGLLIFHTFAKG